MHTRRVKHGHCCLATVNYQLIHSDKPDDGPDDQVLATMEIGKPKNKKNKNKKGACVKSCGLFGYLCCCCNKCCCGVCDMCCLGIRCIAYCPCRCAMCCCPPDVIMVDKTVNGSVS